MGKRIEVLNEDVDIILTRDGVWYLYKYATAGNLESNEDFPTADAARSAYSRGTVSWKAVKVL